MRVDVTVVVARRDVIDVRVTVGEYIVVFRLVTRVVGTLIVGEKIVDVSIKVVVPDVVS